MTRTAFIDQVNALASSEHVRINDAKLAEFTAYLNSKSADEWAQGLPNWDNYLSDGAKNGRDGGGYDVATALHELVLSTAQNAGYTDQNPDGTTRKWGINGSGSRGWIKLYTAMREEGALPGLSITNPQVVEAAVRPYFAGEKGPEELRGSPIPLVDERIAIYRELCSPEARALIQQIAEDARQPDGSYRFTMENTVEKLAEAFPNAFGADPLRKKACLVPILLAANAESHGVRVVADVSLPADYRVPQTYHQWGILEFSADLAATLNSNALLAQDDPNVLAVRAAAVQVGEMLREKTALPTQVLDAIPFVASSPEHAPKTEITGEKIALGSQPLRELPRADRPINSSGLFI